MRSLLRPAWILAAWMVLLGTARVALLVAYRGEFAALDSAGLAGAFLTGLRLDLSISARFLAPVLLALVLPFRWSASRGWRLAWSRVALIAVLLGLILMLGDLIYFGLTGRHVGGELYELENDLDIVLAVAVADYLPALALYLLLAAGVLWVWRRLERWDEARSAGARAPLWLAPTMIAAVVLAGRGGLQNKPVGIATAYSSGLEQGLLALNAPYGLYHSRKSRPIAMGRRLPANEALALVRAQVVAPGETLTAPEHLPVQRRPAGRASTTRPNIVIVLLESWDARFVDALRVVRGEAPLGATPSFDALAAGGLLFTRFYAAGQYSMNGITALLTGVPSIANASTLSRGLEQSELSYLGRMARAEGWSTHFVRGAKRSSFHLDDVAPMAGFERYSGMEDIIARPGTTLMDSWGVWDHHLFDELRRQDLEAPRPFLSFAFTVSTHEPYQTPREHERRFKAGAEHGDYLESLAYADACLGRYVEAARASGLLENTLLLVVSDHAARLPGGASRSLASQLEIPCLIVGPGVTPGRYDGIASQVDLLPTLAALVGWKCEHAALGRDLLSSPPPPEHGALGAVGDLLVQVESTGWIAHDRTQIVQAVELAPGFDARMLEKRLLARIQVATWLLAQNRLFDAAAGTHTAGVEGGTARAANGQ